MRKWAVAFVSMVLLALVAGQIVEAAPSSEAIVVEAVESTAPSSEGVPAPSGLTDPSYDLDDRTDFVRTELRLVLAEPQLLGEEADVQRLPDDGVRLRPAVDFVAPQSTPLREIGPKGDPGATGLFIKTQKQQEHILGTANHANRVKQGGTPSVWNPGVNADGMTRHAWQNGTQVPGRPGVRDFDVGSPVGIGPGGGSQTTIRVHMDGKGQIHGHPVGPETP